MTPLVGRSFSTVQRIAYAKSGSPEKSVTSATTQRKPVTFRSNLRASPAQTPATTFSSLLL